MIIKWSKWYSDPFIFHVFCPSAMIVYRVFRHENKFFVKLVHFGLQLVALAVAVWGLKAVFDFHNHNNIPNLYSLHSWCGLGTVILFACQVSQYSSHGLLPKNIHISPIFSGWSSTTLEIIIKLKILFLKNFGYWDLSFYPFGIPVKLLQERYGEFVKAHIFTEQIYCHCPLHC